MFFVFLLFSLSDSLVVFLFVSSSLFDQLKSLLFSLIRLWTVCQIDFRENIFLLFGHWDRSETHPAYLPTFSVKFIIDAYLFSHSLFTYTYILSFFLSLFTFIYTYSYAYTFIFFPFSFSLHW